MASKENRFSKTEGGAMLTPNDSAQPSFDNQRIRAVNQQNFYPHSNMEEPNQEQAEPDSSENGENPERELIKKGAETALKSAGVPSGIAKGAVKKAEESGALDQVEGTIKKYKTAKTLKLILPAVGAIISSLMPIILIVIILIVVILNILGPIMALIDFLNNLFTAHLYPKYEDYLPNSCYLIASVDSDFAKNASTLVAEGKISDKGYYRTYYALDNDYIDGIIRNNIDNLATIKAAAISPLMERMQFPDGKFNDVNGFFENVSNNWFDVFVYAGLVKDDEANGKVTYFEVAGFDNESAIENDWFKYFVEPPDGSIDYYNNIFNGSRFNNWKDLIKFSENGSDTDIGRNDSIRISLNVAILINEEGYYFDKETYIEFLKYYVDQNIENEEREDFVNSDQEYIYKNFKTQIEELKENGSTDDEAKNTIINNIMSVFDYYHSLYVKEYSSSKIFEEYTFGGPYTNNIVYGDGIKQYLSNQNMSYCQTGMHDYWLFLDPEISAGSGDETTVVDELASIYGNNSCSILEEYNPLTHEYVVSQGAESNEIHSVSDGEVIYVNYDGVNLYDNYDYKTDKCLCNGVMCNNYDGSEIKIKFTYDDIEYIAIYSNLADIKVSVGDIVKKGDVIALEGDTGCTSSKKLTFKLISENGISYNPNELVQRCSTSDSTASVCDFKKIMVNLIGCNNEIRTLSFYDYVKEEVYRNFKLGINNKEFIKAGIVLTATKILHDNNYKIGMTEINIKSCGYSDITINEENSLILDEQIKETVGQVLMYSDKFANIKYSNTCNRTEKDVNANSIYNELCSNEALKLTNKTYEEILKIYYPNFYLVKNYCFDYARKINYYNLNNDKSYLDQNSYSQTKIEKINTNLKNKIEFVNYGTRAGVLEAARFLTLGLEYKIPYKNGGKYYNIGFNKNWYIDGLDSSGFVSWALLNGGAKITNDMTAKEIVSNNTVGSLKITADLYKYYDKIQVGDFAYNDSKIGIIIGKNDGILYVAEANSKDGLIVTEIKSYGESDSNYTHIYFADDYYDGVGKITNMW